jgi:hypothetical protein
MGVVDIKVEQLNESNWGTWSKRVKILLTLQGCNKCIEEDNVEDADKDDKAKALIAAHLSDSYLRLYDEAATAKDLWDALLRTFVQQNTMRRLTLRREVNSLEKSSSESLSKYFARAAKLRDELNGADQDISEDEVVTSIFAGLPRQYDVAIEIMAQSGQALTMEKSFRHLLAVEHKLSKSHEKEPTAYFTKAAGSYRPVGGGGGGGGGHQGSAGGSGFKGGSRSEGPCFYCGRAGHIKRHCRKWIADGKPSKSASVSFASAHAVCAVPQVAESLDWLVDTGASYHMTPNRSLFEKYMSAEEFGSDKFPPCQGC